MDAAVLDARLVTNDFDFPIFPSLSRCAERLGQVARPAAPSSSSGSSSSSNATTATNAGNDESPRPSAGDDGRPTAYALFAREVLQYQREAGKARRAVTTLATEAANYRAAADEVTVEIARVRDEVLMLGVVLRQQEEVRKHREKLEAVAKAVNDRPARSELKRKAAAVAEECLNVEGSIQAADAQLLVRMEQFAALERAVAALQDVAGASGGGGGGGAGGASGEGAGGEGDGDGQSGDGGQGS